VSLAWLAPAWACAVCGAGQGNDQGAYLEMSIVLSLMPLVLIGGVAWWVRGQVRAARAAAG